MDWNDARVSKEMKAVEKRLSAAYSKAYKDVSSILSGYLAKFEERDQELREALVNGTYPKLTGASAGMTPEEHYKQWRINQIGRGKRWEAVKDDIANRIVDTNKTAAKYVNGKTPDIFKESYNVDSFRLENATGVTSFNLVDEEAIAELARGKNHTEFKVLSVNPKRDYAWNKTKIDNALMSGILQGKSIKHLTDNFMGVMRSNRAAAIRNARTAVTSAHNAGRMESGRKAKDMGINIMKEWRSSEDGRVRDSHAHLDRMRVELEDKFPNGLMYPGDPAGAPAEVYNCRCSCRNIPVDYMDARKGKIYNRETGELEDVWNTPENYRKWKEGKEKNKLAKTGNENPYKNTLGHKLDAEKRNELYKYAESKNVKLFNLRKFDGDPELLKSGIDTISDLQEKYSVKISNLVVKGFSNNLDFGETKRNTIYINNLCLRDRKVTESQLGGMFAAERLEEIFTHEYGHVLENNSRANPEKIFNEIIGIKNDEEKTVKHLQGSLSEYAAKVLINDQYIEITSEALIKAERGNLLAIKLINEIRRGL